MPRSKKTNPDQPPASDDRSAADETTAPEGMAHVPADQLASSPDVFARRDSAPAAAADGDAVGASAPSAFAEPQPEATPEPPASAVADTSEPRQTPPAASFVAAPAYGPPAAVRRTSSTTAMGIMLVVVGVFFLLVRLFSIDLSTYGWPLFVIIPGLTLLVVGFVSLGTGAAIPGGIITMVGLVLAYQSATNDWASWAFAWALVAPGGVGVGMFLQGLRDHNVNLTKQGRLLMFAGAIIFAIGFVFFESVLNISGMDYGIAGKAALPTLLIVIGVILLARSVQNSRRA